jgi:two-component system sensor histidine kinase YesM
VSANGDRKRPQAKRWAPFFSNFMTLKKRIVIIFILGMLIPYACITAVSYFTISSILVNKIQSGIQDNLKQVQLFLENTLKNLNHISQQLTLDGAVGSMLEEFLANPNPFERAILKRDIRNELNLIAFTNPNVGVIMYFFQDGTGSRDLETSPIKENFSPDTLPLLASYYGIVYYGPHLSNDRFSDQYVLSALRKVDMPDRDDVYVYIESGFKLTQSILNSDRVGQLSFHLMLDNDGRIAFSEIPAVFPVNSRFVSGTAENFGLAHDYYWFKATGNQGWSVVSLIPKAEYNKEKVRWVDQIAMLFMIFMVLSVFLAILLWRMVYKPLNLFSREMSWIDQDDFKFVSIPTRIPEFDFLLDQFQVMKKRIMDLLAEVEQKEKRRAALEIENLLFQINPHFLMNSLNTIHWLAVEKNQDEIDRLVLALNRLLFYNLGKMGRSTTLREEIEALKEYLLLQQSRYDFRFDVVLHAEERVLETTIPRFILQPLVENALFHGLSDSGHIWIEIESAERIDISIHDNGPGMSEEKIRGLLNGEPDTPEKIGMGIGLQYVKRVLEAYYSGLAGLDITSAAGKGTSVRVRLPAREATV